MTNPTVLVTGSSGRVGKAVVAFLNKSGKFNVRATARDLSKADFLKSIGAHEVVQFDLKDQSTWGPATDGVTHIFSSSMDALIAQHLEFAKYLGANHKDKIKHVVRISCFGADTNTNAYDKDIHSSMDGQIIPLMLQHYWWGEQCLINEGLPVTSIRGNFYMNHLMKNEIENIEKEGFFASPIGDCKNSYVCSNDMAEVSAICFQEGPERHANKFYDITGPEPHSMTQIAAVLSEVSGKKVEYRAQDIDQFETDFGPTRRAFFEYLRNGFYTRCSPDFYNLTGRKPTSYKEYLANTGPFGETGLQELFSSAGSIYTKGVDQFKDLGKVKMSA